MPEPEPTDDELLAQAAECPVIAAAYRTGDTEVIRRMEAAHPPSRCAYVKMAAEKVREQPP
jgi:hypothetical protein